MAVAAAAAAAAAAADIAAAAVRLSKGAEVRAKRTDSTKLALKGTRKAIGWSDSVLPKYGQESRSQSPTLTIVIGSSSSDVGVGVGVGGNVS